MSCVTFESNERQADVPWGPPRPPCSRTAAWARVAAVDPAAYARSRNALDGAVTGLGPALTHGVLTLPEALAGVLARGALPAQHRLVFEFGWREYFHAVWAARGAAIFRSLHDGPRPDADYADAVPADVREARSGVPVVDEAVRTLYATGGLHNHARLWLASYLVHLRGVHWRAGADWLYGHLLDGDLASNTLSWQWVAGTASRQPYLFDAASVARYAGPAWHSAGTVVDTERATLEAWARGHTPLPAPRPAPAAAATAEPPCTATPPSGLARDDVDALLARVEGRRVWWVHPWALRPPPDDLPAGTCVVAVSLAEGHAARPWSARRWQFVGQAAASLGVPWWHLYAASWRRVITAAREVRAVADPHLDPACTGLEADALPAGVHWQPPPRLFAEVDWPAASPDRSFSWWWSRVTRGVRDASDLPGLQPAPATPFAPVDTTAVDSTPAHTPQELPR